MPNFSMQCASRRITRMSVTCDLERSVTNSHGFVNTHGRFVSELVRCVIRASSSSSSEAPPPPPGPPPPPPPGPPPPRLPAAAHSKPGSNKKVECTLCPASASILVFPRHRVTAPRYPALLQSLNGLQLLVRRLHKREKPAPANAAGRCVRQLRHDGASSPTPRALRLRCLPVTVTNALPSR